MKNLTKLLFIAALALAANQSSALSCLQTPSSVAYIGNPVVNIAKNTSGYTEYTLKNRKYISYDRSVSNIADYTLLSKEFSVNTLSYKDIISHEYPFDLRIPANYSDLLQKGDVVVNGAPGSVSACGGPGTYAIFDKNSGKLKILYYQNAAYSQSYDIGGSQLSAESIGDKETNTEITFSVDGKSTKLAVSDNQTLASGKKLHLLSLKNKSDDIWFGTAHYSFLVELNEGSSVDLCKIPYSGLIQYGSRGEDVRALQNCLNALGYSTGFADGKYGPKTYTGIKKFQKSESISQDGIVGPITVNYLNKK